MSEKESPYRKIQKNLIDVPNWVPRKSDDEEDRESIKGLSENIKIAGLLNPITIKEKNNGRFDLIAGSRRLKASSDDDLWAKIENKNIDEFDARIKCQSENEQRVNLDPMVRDKFYHETFELGKKLKKIKTIKDLADLMGKNKETIGKYIYAGKEREMKKDDIIINTSKTSPLFDTKSLSKTPIIRNKILEMSRDDVLTGAVLPIVSKNIENCLKSGVSEKIVAKVIDMIKDDGNNGSNNIVSYNFDEKKFGELTTVIMECQPDVRDYVIDKKISAEEAVEINIYPPDIRKSVANRQISLEDAKEISKSETIEARKQLITEKVKYKQWSERAENVLNNKWKKTLSTRQQQEIDMKINGNTDLKTEFDIQYQRKLDIEAEKALYFDENAKKRFKRVYDDLVLATQMVNPTKITKKETKIVTVNTIIETYKLCRLLLIDLGIGSNPETDFINVDFSEKYDSNSTSNE